LSFLTYVKIEIMKDSQSEKSCCGMFGKKGMCCRRGSGCGGNGAVYGLGFIGAAVYFVGQATTFGAGVVGFLKALVWPAFLVYAAFSYLLS
jgi:hypothetical protein